MRWPRDCPSDPIRRPRSPPDLTKQGDLTGASSRWIWSSARTGVGVLTAHARWPSKPEASSARW